MAKRKTPKQVISEYMAAIGSKGGKAKVPKGLAKLPKNKRSAIAKAAAQKRWAKAE